MTWRGGGFVGNASITGTWVYYFWHVKLKLLKLLATSCDINGLTTCDHCL